MIRIHYCCRCNHEWPSKLESPKTCAKCRSPYWNVPKTTYAVDPNVPTENKKNSAASPGIEENPFAELVRKNLHPGRTDGERKEQINSLKSLLDIPPKKESVLPTYPTQVDEYGPTLNYD